MIFLYNKMSEIIFIYGGQNIKIRCNKNEKIKDICIKLCTKINIDINSLIFLYGGKQLNLENKINDITKENNISILVYKIENEDICPKCRRIINNKIIDEILILNSKMNNRLTGIKITIEYIMNKKDINYINNQLEIINVIINNMNEDLKKMNNNIKRRKMNNIIIKEKEIKNKDEKQKLIKENESINNHNLDNNFNILPNPQSPIPQSPLI